MAKSKLKSKSLKRNSFSPFNNYWTKSNYVLGGIGFLILLLGFYFMAQGPWDNPISLSISPLVLLLAYLIIFPLSILYRKKTNTKIEDVSSKS